MNRIPDDQRELALDLVYDRRREGDPTAIVPPYKPLTAFLEALENVTEGAGPGSRFDAPMELPLDERLQRRIIDGEKNCLEPISTRRWPGGRSRCRSSTTRCCPG